MNNFGCRWCESANLSSVRQRIDEIALAALLLASGTGLTTLAGCAALHSHPMSRAQFWGFTAPWDPRSAASVAAHGNELAAVVSGFITLDSVSFRPLVLFPDALASHAGPHRRSMALVTTYEGDRFHPEIIRGLAGDSTALGRTAGATASLLGAGGYRGAVLDFEGLTPNDFDALLRATRAFADSARAHGIPEIGMAVPATDTASYPARPFLADGRVDFVVVMLYDQHWPTSPPGPIASPEWANRALGLRAGEAGASRIVAAYPVYGYEWRRDSAAAAVISFEEARQLARGAQVPLVRDPASATLHAEARDWSVWVSDAVLLDSLVRGGRRLGVNRFALWRLGLEDPRVWTEVVR